MPQKPARYRMPAAQQKKTIITGEGRYGWFLYMKLRILGQMRFADTEALTPNRNRCQDFARFVPVFSAAVAADATVSEHMWVAAANSLNGLHGLGRRRFCRNTIQTRWAPKVDGGIVTRIVHLQQGIRPRAGCGWWGRPYFLQLWLKPHSSQVIRLPSIGLTLGHAGNFVPP